MTDRVAALLRDEPISWYDLGVSTEEFLAFCDAEGLTGLVQHKAAVLAESKWPHAIQESITTAARAGLATELVRVRELRGALETLDHAGVYPVLFKGTALAYTVYESPSLRPRQDSDIFVPHDRMERATRALTGRGYGMPLYCGSDSLFYQSEYHYHDTLNVQHVFDVHWKLSVQEQFAELLNYEEMARSSVAVPTLGAHARVAGPLHALLIACIHPAMHHRNEERLLWLHDVHLLASRLSPEEWGPFVQLAQSKGVAAICASELARARARLGTQVDDSVIQRLESTKESEPTAAYLEPGRRWHHELLDNFKSMGWRKGPRMLREVAFPSPSYMLRSFNLPDTAWLWPVVPALYAVRGARGMLKVLRGRK